jgi:hypothetical protein
MIGWLRNRWTEVVDMRLDVVVLFLVRFELQSKDRGLKLPIFVDEGKLIRTEQRGRS